MDEETSKKDLERIYLVLSKRYNIQQNSSHSVKDVSVSNKEDISVSHYTKKDLWHIVKSKHSNRRHTEYSFAAHYFYLETQN